ncbi:hypothetical protein JB92DRAFT_3093475 [Gautieria morchelliformis]|nr:hypothetical protein JB92DRAFT_3093475 [Gautieria morchelliformis]
MMSSAFGSASMEALGVLLSIGAGSRNKLGCSRHDHSVPSGGLRFPGFLHATSATKGAAIATISYWLFNLIIVQVSQVMMQKLDWKTYIMFFQCLIRTPNLLVFS